MSASANKATVMRYTGGSWQAVGAAGFSADEAIYASLAFYGGEAYVAYQDNASADKATVMRYSAPPAIQATGVVFTNVGATGATLDWTRGNGGACAVFAKEGSSSSAAPANNTTYTADTAFGSGTQIGSTGWYCVYKGSGTSVTVTDLSSGTIYRVMVCEYNGPLGGEQYSTDTAAGNPGDVTTAGITVNPTSGLVTTEAGGTDTFTIVLNTEPTANVTIPISSSDTTEGTVSPASLTFTNANWSTPQTVTVTGVNDDVDDGDVGYTIVTAAAVSTDGNYNGLNASDVSVTNTDNDTAGITVNPTSGLTTTEAGGTAQFTVVLNSQPTASVTIGISSSDTTEGAVSPASLTFANGDWDTPQTVTATGVDDALADGDIAYTIVTAAATSTDPGYNGLNASDVSVTNTDDDTAGITVNPTSGLTTTEAGGTAQFTIVLDSQPTDDVTIGLSSSDTTEGTVSPTSVTFTNANWSTPQTVTATGVDDALADGDIAYTIVTAAAVSTDPGYSGLNPSDVSVTNTDNDTVGATTPTVTTAAVSEITTTTATCGGNVTADGGADVTARGVCWSTSADPTTADDKTADGSGTGAFVSSITNLEPGTTYHVRAYAINSAGTAYGAGASFTAVAADTGDDDSSPQPDLLMTITALTEAAQVGDDLTFQVTVENVGGVLASGVLLRVPVPPGTQFVSARALADQAGSATPLNAQLEGDQIVIELGALAGDGNLAIELVLRALAAGTVTLQANAACDESATPATARANADVQVADEYWEIVNTVAPVHVCGWLGVTPLFTLLGLIGVKRRGWARRGS